jgi:hypothetical protein
MSSDMLIELCACVSLFSKVYKNIENHLHSLCTSITGIPLAFLFLTDTHTHTHTHIHTNHTTHTTRHIHLNKGLSLTLLEQKKSLGKEQMQVRADEIACTFVYCMPYRARERERVRVRVSE